MNRTIIRNGFVVSQDAQIGNVDNLDVLIEADKIIAIDHQIEVTDAETIDATGCIVMPGFIDAHRHIWQGAMRGVCADWSIMDYVRGIRMNAARFYEAEDMYAAQLQGALEAVDAGVTTVTDYCHNILTPEHAQESIRGLSESGLRAIWNYGFNFPPMADPFFKTFDERVSFLRKLAIQHFSSKDQLLTLGVAPEEMMFVGSAERLDAQLAAAREVTARIFWHCNGTSEPPPREVDMLHNRGTLGDDMLLVHMYGTQDDEWQMLADAGASVAFTPETELQMGMMWPANHKARKFGVNQSYGTDIVSNNSADMFTALRLGLQAMRGHLIDQEGAPLFGVPFTCEEALNWGLMGAAQALGMQDVIGSLSPGKQADIVLIDGNSLTMSGWDRSNVASAILLHAQARDVDSVWIAGKAAKRNGKLVANTERPSSLLKAATDRVRSKVEAVGGFLISPEELTMRLNAVAESESGDYKFEEIS